MSNDQAEQVMEQKGTRKNASKSKPGVQNPLLGIGAGVGATIAGTAVWILIAQKYKMPMFSIAVAFGIAYAMQFAGKVTSKWFGLIGAFLSGLMAVTGSIVTGFYIIKIKYPTMSLVKMLKDFDFENIVTLLNIAGMPLSVLCITASVVIGFWFSIKHEPKKPVELPY